MIAFILKVFKIIKTLKVIKFITKIFAKIIAKFKKI